MLKDDSQNRRPEPGAAGGPTRLGPGAVVQGEISGGEDFVIEGRFQGKISLERNDLTIARGARVEAEIRVRNLTLHGELTGNVTAGERVVLAESARMKGDVTTARISITDGAQFRGSIKMEKAPAAAA